jgi:hypothetical protein
MAAISGIAQSPEERIRLAAVEQSGAPAPGDRDLEPADVPGRTRLPSHFLHDDMTNEISIEVDGNTITGSYEVNRGMIVVSGGILGSKSEPLGGPSTTELLARRLLRELYVESRRPQTT